MFRPFDPDRDRQALSRTWRECGWADAEKDEQVIDLLVGVCRTTVAEVEGEAECFVMTGPGTMRHLDEVLPLSLVYAVTTSRLARRRGLATRLTAEGVAHDVANGASVVGLGMFEQGFYDRLGFGTGVYERFFEFDPARLVLPEGVRARVPKRITADDYEAVHANRLARRPVHGGCNLPQATDTKAEMVGGKGGFGLGYFDGADGELTHHLWCVTGGEDGPGPYRVRWLAWRTRDQLLELLALLRGLGDQVRLLRLKEPVDVQLQDFLHEPWRAHRVTEGSKFAQRQWFHALWQMRIGDLARCLRQTRLDAEPVRFNLALGDSIETLLPEDAPWRGVGGDYVVTLGPDSSAEPGRAPDLPTLRADVGAFTRMWLGVRSATGLAITDRLEGPPDLLGALDRVLRLPEPHPGWDF